MDSAIQRLSTTGARVFVFTISGRIQASFQERFPYHGLCWVRQVPSVGQASGINHTETARSSFEVPAGCFNKNNNNISPRSIYENSNMTLRLSGNISIFGLVFFVLKSLLGIARQWSRKKKFAILFLKPRSHSKIVIFRKWAI